MKQGRFFSIFLVCLLAIPIQARAGAYKCVDSGGHVSFQDQECPKSSSSSEVKIKSYRHSEPSYGEDISNQSAIRESPTPSNSSESISEKTQQFAAICVRGMSTQKDLAKKQRYCSCAAREFFSDPALNKTLLENPNSKDAAKRAIDSGLKCFRKLM